MADSGIRESQMDRKSGRNEFIDLTGEGIRTGSMETETYTATTDNVKTWYSNRAEAVPNLAPIKRFFIGIHPAGDPFDPRQHNRTGHCCRPVLNGTKEASQLQRVT